MIDVSQFVASLTSAGIDFFCGVPDSLLKNFCAYITDSCGDKHIITANEGGAIGLAAGHYLATGKPALVYMQNSGQGNAVNPLASLADPDVYSIPMLLLVGWRGEPGVHDEPQHVKQGKVTLSLFETLGIPTTVLSDEWKDQVSSAVELAMREKRPVALIVRKGLFGDYKLQNKKPDIAALPREQAIEGILNALPPDAVIVSTTGMISRELYEIRERLGQRSKVKGQTKDDKFHCLTSDLSPQPSSLTSPHSHDFLTVGSMGHASMIALGIAKAQPNRTVVCLDGDGASIMQMGNMAIVGQSKCHNLIHIVLNNSAHDSVGGQPTVGGDINLESIAETLGYAVLQSPENQYSTPNLTAAQVADALHFDFSTLALCKEEELKYPQPKFLAIKVAKGARPDLGRPKESPQVNKELFMKYIGGEGVMDQILHVGKEGAAEFVENFASVGNVVLVTDGAAYSLCGAEAFFNSVSPCLCVKNLVVRTPNPKVEEVQALLDQLSGLKVSAFIAVGGGTATDTTKLLNLAISINKDIKSILQLQLAPPTLLPFLAVPTTAGTGAEATRFAVCYDGETKYSIDFPQIRPSHVLLMPDFIATLPRYQKLSTNFDAYAQAVESLWAKGATDESRAYATRALALMKEANTPLSNSNSTSNSSSHSNSSLQLELQASYWAGRAIDISRTTAAHAFSYYMTSHYGIPHGHAVYMMFEYICRNNNHPEYIKVVPGLTTLRDFAAEKGIEWSTLVDDLFNHVNLKRLGNNPVEVRKESFK